MKILRIPTESALFVVFCGFFKSLKDSLKFLRRLRRLKGVF